VSWLPPGRSNGIVHNYSLYAYYPIDDFGNYGQVVLKTGKFNTYTVVDLKPYTNYSFMVGARNEMGSSKSQWTNITTMEDGM